MAKKALVLMNMGGPNNVDEVELFLRNMFADKNILPFPWIFRKILGTIIIKSRLHEAQNNYKAIGSKSPLPKLTDNIIKKLQKLVDNDTVVVPAMRYTPPFADDVLPSLRDSGVTQLYLFPMYPQYSTTTTKSSVEDVYRALEEMEWAPEVSTVDHYHEDTRYQQAVAKAINAKLNKHPGYDVIFSAHGLPQSIVDKGDPYEKHIQQSVDGISRYLHGHNKIHLAYQSKVGKGKWLSPSLDEKLKEIENKNVIIYPIAFTVDNSESVFELKIEYRQIAQELGFKDYIVCSCLNADGDFVDFINTSYERMQKDDAGV
ncbi:MAG: ferrochelatase [Campylobacterota bacterium]